VNERSRRKKNGNIFGMKYGSVRNCFSLDLDADDDDDDYLDITHLVTEMNAAALSKSASRDLGLALYCSKCGCAFEGRAAAFHSVVNFYLFATIIYDCRKKFDLFRDI
jgi:hypothetical protein